MDHCGIYSIEHPASGKFYIGSSFRVNARWYAHKRLLMQGRHHSQHLQNAWTMYGEDAFRMRLLEECPREILREREQAYLDAYRPAFNGRLTVGPLFTDDHLVSISRSQKGRTFTEVTKEKMRAAKLGQAQKPEHRAAAAAARTGKSQPWKHGYPMTEEIKAKISDAQKGVPREYARKPRPEEVREKIAAGMIGNQNGFGKPCPPEKAARISAAQAGREFTEEHKAKLRAAAQRRWAKTSSDPATP